MEYFWAYTNEISKIRFRDVLWIDSGEISLEIELISHHKETKVDLQNELWKFYLYRISISLLRMYTVL